MTESDEVDGERPGWHDDPISSVGQDRLRRAPFAEHAARLINENHTAESSVVYGLEGPWGSGKSSVIAMITTFLTAPRDGVDGLWRFVSFTPWATSGTEALLEEFFAALGEAAPKTERTRRLRERITAYADIARPLAAAIPGVGTAIAEASRAVEERLRKPWNVAFAEVAAELRDLGTPILVVVDDIDRLQPAELLDLLKVVRLLGRFPGVDFLLAYDEQTLVETLQDPSRGRVSTARARAFMEKIVQYPLSMPPLLTGKIVKILDAGLTEIVTLERVETNLEKHRIGRMVLTTMPSQLTTPRAIERFLAQVREQFRIHDLDEMNDVDLILATFLRVQFPDLFAHLQRWKTELTRGSTGSIGLASRDETTPDWETLLAAVEDDQDRHDARAVLQTLFPAFAEKHAARAKAGRFAHPDYFDRYLAQSIPEGDIPDAVIARALAQAAGGHPDELLTLVLAEDDEQVTLALSKIRVRYPDVGEPWTRGEAPEGPVSMELLRTGMRLVDQLPDRVAAWTSSQSQTTYWMANLLRLLLNANPGTDVDPALAVCTQTHRRAHVLSIATSTMERIRPETQEALRSALRREATRILPMLLADLRGRDDSKSEPGSPFLYGVVDKAGLLPELQAAVREGVGAGDFTVEDVAARFVGFAYIVGGPTGTPPSSASFSGGLFSKVTGVQADSADHSERETWIDTSWARRRAFAARYIKEPAAETS
ncbi:KAP family P-loop NTPase fold protein [Geodermatophilus sp. URMC 63]